MKLKKQNNNANKKISTIDQKKAFYRNKNSSMDNLKTNNKKGIYVNKILKETISKKKQESELNDMYPNFNSNIRNILTNEEKREKAIRYIINMRKRQRLLSPAIMKSNYLIDYETNNDLDSNRENDKFARTINKGFYSSKKIKNQNKLNSLSMQDIDNYDSIDLNKYEIAYKIYNSKKHSINNYNEIIPYGGDNKSRKKKYYLISSDKFIKVNKLNKKKKKINLIQNLLIIQKIKLYMLKIIL